MPDYDSTDVSAGSKLLRDNAEYYRLGWDYYTGDRAEYFSGSSRLARRLRLQGQAFRVNMARIPVDAVAARLEVSNFTTTNDTLDKALQESWDRNRLTFTLPELFRKAGAMGDSYMIAWGEGDDDPETGVERHEVTVNYNSPLSCRVVYDRDRPWVKLYAVKQWRADDDPRLGEVWRANTYYADRLEKWVTAAGKKPSDDQAWEPFSDDDGDHVYPHDAGEVPVYHFRTALQYGKPLHYEFYGAQDALNKLTISHMSTVDFHSFPQRYRILEASANPDEIFGDDDLFDVDDGVSDESDADSEKQLRTGPGTMWDLRGTKAVGQFEPSLPATFTDPAEFYVRMGATATDTPLYIFDPSGGAPSGESRRRADAPLVKRVEMVRQLFDSELSAMLSTVLRLSGYGDAVPVKLDWKPAEMVTDLEGWAVVKAKQDAGVPVPETLVETGYAGTAVEKWYPEDSSQGVASVAQLELLGRVMKDLATAVTLGLVSEEEARGMLPPELLQGVPPDGG